MSYVRPKYPIVNKARPWRLYAIILFVLGMATRFLVYPNLLKIPYDFHDTTEFEGQISVLELVDIDNQDFPVRAILETKGVGGHEGQVKIEQAVDFETVISKQNVLVREIIDYFLDHANIKEDYWERLKLVFGTENISNTFWVDSKQATYISPPEIGGLSWAFPLGKAKKDDYDVWDSITQTQVRMKFIEEDKYEGMKVYKYSADINSYDLGSFQIPRLDGRVRLDATGNWEVWTEMNSNVPVYSSLDVSVFAQVSLVRMDVLQIHFEPLQDERIGMISTAKKARTGVFVAKSLIPVISLLGSAYFYFRSGTNRGLYRS